MTEAITTSSFVEIDHADLEIIKVNNIYKFLALNQNEIKNIIYYCEKS